MTREMKGANEEGRAELAETGYAHKKLGCRGEQQHVMYICMDGVWT